MRGPSRPVRRFSDEFSVSALGQRLSTCVSRGCADLALVVWLAFCARIDKRGSDVATPPSPTITQQLFHFHMFSTMSRRARPENFRLTCSFCFLFFLFIFLFYFILRTWQILRTCSMWRSDCLRLKFSLYYIWNFFYSSQSTVCTVFLKINALSLIQTFDHQFLDCDILPIVWSKKNIIIIKIDSERTLLFVLLINIMFVSVVVRIWVFLF